LGLLGVGAAQVAPEQLAQVVDVLHRQRAVEAQLLADALDRLHRGAAAGDHARRVGRQQERQQERDDADAEQHAGGLQQALREIADHRRSARSRASRSASPRRLNDSEVSTMAMPGKITSQGASRKYDWLSLMMPPQLGAGGCTPTPRNDSDASSSTVVEMPSVPNTIRVLTRCGRMWRNSVRKVPTPRAPAASTNSRCRIDSTWA